LAADPKLATNNQRIEARPWLIPKVAAVFKRYGKDQLEQLCLEADISFAPVARPQDLFDHPHLLANGSLAPTTLPGGVKTRLPLLPFQMFGWRPPLTRDPPEVGQHNDEVLAEIGYDKAAIAGLKAASLLGPK
jgi:crotonobetainyl-CoA:carnitine CoA-transferase CaiB-like acyl-CoA transferase